MRLLAIESSSSSLSLAGFEDGALRLELSEEALMRQNETLAPLVAKLLQKLGWKASQLGAVAVSLGPGSFTGLRTGLAFAKGICFASKAAMIGVPTLQAWAEGQPQAEVWLDARRGMIYRLAPGKEAGLLPLDQARSELAGGVAVLGDLLEPKGRLQASAVGRLALERLARGESDDPVGIEPIYLRRAEAEILWEKIHPSAAGRADGA